MKKGVFKVWAILALISSFLVLFFFSTLVLYEKVCFYELKLPVLAFEWVLALAVFIISLYSFIALILRHYEVSMVRKK